MDQPSFHGHNLKPLVGFTAVAVLTMTTKIVCPVIPVSPPNNLFPSAYRAWILGVHRFWAQCRQLVQWRTVGINFQQLWRAVDKASHIVKAPIVDRSGRFFNKLASKIVPIWSSRKTEKENTVTNTTDRLVLASHVLDIFLCAPLRKFLSTQTRSHMSHLKTEIFRDTSHIKASSWKNYIGWYHSRSQTRLSNSIIDEWSLHNNCVLEASTKSSTLSVNSKNFIVPKRMSR